MFLIHDNCRAEIKASLHTKPLDTIFWEVARYSWHQTFLLLCFTTKDVLACPVCVSITSGGKREGEEDSLDES